MTVLHQIGWLLAGLGCLLLLGVIVTIVFVWIPDHWRK